MLSTSTIPQVRPARHARETTTRALRHAVWIALVLAQQLELTGLQDALTRLLGDIDRLLYAGDRGEWC